MRRPEFDKMSNKFLRVGMSTHPYHNPEYIDFASFPETLKPIYYYHRLKRSSRDSDVLWKFVQPVYRFELNELYEEEEGEADRVLFEVCEGVIIPVDEQRKLFKRNRPGLSTSPRLRSRRPHRPRPGNASRCGCVSQTHDAAFNVASTRCDAYRIRIKRGGRVGTPHLLAS